MKNKLFCVLLICFFIVSCNPRMHIIGGAMRYHNLSQNKYQPKTTRKKVKIGKSDNSPVFIFLRRR